MILVTRLTDTGIQIGVAPSVDSFTEDMYEDHNVPSESYLRVIEELVLEAGGWNSLQEWYTSVAAESFTSIRGLVTLVNSLAPLHGADVFVFKDAPSDAQKAELPIVPNYSSEPNISKRN